MYDSFDDDDVFLNFYLNCARKRDKRHLKEGNRYFFEKRREKFEKMKIAEETFFPLMTGHEKGHQIPLSVFLSTLPSPSGFFFCCPFFI